MQALTRVFSGFRASEPSEPPKKPQQILIEQLSSDTLSPILYPDQARCVDCFVAGARENKEDAAFIQSRDLLFFDGIVRLADGTADGKKIEIKGGELYIPFFALTKEKKEISFFLPYSLIQKAQENNNKLPPLLINGKQMEFYIQPDGDPRFFVEDNFIDGVAIDVNGKQVKRNEACMRVTLQDIFKNALRQSVKECKNDILWGPASTPVPIDQLNKVKMYPIFTCSQVQNKMEVAALTNAINVCKSAVPDALFAQLNADNCSYGKFRFNAQSFQLHMEMAGLGHNELFGYKATKQHWLTEDNLIILKQATYELREGQEFVEKNIKDNQLTVFNFSEHGITLEQMQKAKESYENGMLIWHIPAQA